MKNIICLIFILSSMIAHAQVEWSASANYLFEAEGIGYLDPPNRYTGFSSAFLLKANGSISVGDRIVMGGYSNISPGVEVWRFDETLATFEFGYFIGPRFEIAGAHELQPIAEVGYRVWSSGPIHGLGTNLNVKFIINKAKDISPLINLGFITQPAGGNSDFWFSHSPYWFIGGGARF